MGGGRFVWQDLGPIFQKKQLSVQMHALIAAIE